MALPFAYLEHVDRAGARRVFLAESEIATTDSPVVRLIEGIYEREPRHAREILRSRIFCSEEPNEFARGMIKVSAKRWSPATDRPAGDVVRVGAKRGPRGAIAAPAGAWTRESFLERLNQIQPVPDPAAPLHARDRDIAAVLLDREHRVLGAALNTNATERTLHAEVNVIRNHVLAHGALPAGFVLLSTRKPCRMCAGLIWECAGPARDFQVFYRDFDPGPLARETVLNTDPKRAWETQLGPKPL